MKTLRHYMLCQIKDQASRSWIERDFSGRDGDCQSWRCNDGG